jgi:hypothetical protein
MAKYRLLIAFFIGLAAAARCPVGLSENGTVEILSNCSFAPGTYSFGTLTIPRGVTVSMMVDSSCAYATLRVENMTVEGSIKAEFADSQQVEESHWGAGGSNGGQGGASIYSSAPDTSSPTWMIDADTTLMCGGPGGKGDGDGGRGGGIIDIVATGTIIINGNIAANGQDAQDHGAGGGKTRLLPIFINNRIGAGGSIRLAAATIIGSGSIEANGGNILCSHMLMQQVTGGGSVVAVAAADTSTFSSHRCST